MKRILVGLDGSPNERNVLDIAVKLSSQLGGKLVLFRAVSLPIGLPSNALALPPDNIGLMLADTAKQHLDQVARTLPSDIIDRVQVEIGVPWRAVCDTAEADQCDLIVVGSHGYSGIDRLIGTTAAKIVNHAPCSVLIARPGLTLTK
jgi:nucleotide-binding universal stress UspA family protein